MPDLPELDIRRLGEGLRWRDRLIDVMCLVMGGTLVATAIVGGGVAWLLLFPGVGLLAIGAFLFTRRQRMARPSTLVGWFQEVLEEDWDGPARSAAERRRRLAVCVKAAVKLAELGAGEQAWAVIGGPSRETSRVAFVEVTLPGRDRRLCVLVPEPAGAPSLCLYLPTVEERERAGRAFAECVDTVRDVVRVDVRSEAEAVAGAERAVIEVYGGTDETEADFRLRHLQPRWMMGDG
ncbi:MAG: hypothetical protein ACODAJ_12905 [Planctomycetota bacterium]